MQKALLGYKTHLYASEPPMPGTPPSPTIGTHAKIPPPPPAALLYASEPLMPGISPNLWLDHQAWPLEPSLPFLPPDLQAEPPTNILTSSDEEEHAESLPR